MTAVKIIKALMAKGHSAYLVGGCVRDIACGEIPADFDIATSASVDEIIAAASENNWKTVLTGKVFGVVIIVINGSKYETASFRTDVYGSDSHRPALVNFVNSIYDDLSRRDFTINAMAMDIDGNILDPFDGRTDLKKKIVKAVGNPSQRFAEDGLRMFRAVRFAARFGFEIEPATLAAISQNRRRVQGLSVERILAETEKILISDNPVRGIKLLIKTGLADEACLARVEKKEYRVSILPELKYLKNMSTNSRLNAGGSWEIFLERTPKNITLRWTSLLYSIAGGMSSCIEKSSRPQNIGKKYSKLALLILKRLKVKPKQADFIIWLIGNHLEFPQNNLPAITGWLGAISKNFPNYSQMRKALVYLLLLYKAAHLSYDPEPRLLAKTVSQALRTFPFFPTQLAVSGKEIAANLGRGRQVKLFQLKMLAEIQQGLIENTAASLLDKLPKEKQELF